MVLEKKQKRDDKMVNSNSTKTTLNVRTKISPDISRIFPDEKIEIYTLKQVREILSKALQGKSLTDYIREDRDA